MPDDVSIRFVGDADDAEHAVGDLDRALETLGALLKRIQDQLQDFAIPGSVVTRFVADVGIEAAALGKLEDQANDTRRALDRMGLPLVSGAAMAGHADLGPTSMIAAFARGMTYTRNWPAPAGANVAPITGVQSNPWVAPPWPMFEGNRWRMFPPWVPGGNGDDNNRRMLGRVLGWNDPAIFPPEPPPERPPLGLLAALGIGGGHMGGGGRGGFLGGMPGWMGYFGRMFGGLPVARFGSALGLAGFGAERMLGTGLGIAGSMGGALLGGGAYALGGLGTMAVGMGTDMAGIGQAAGDIKSVTQAQNNLTQAIALYGPKSREAALAQAQLNQTLNSFSPVARQAVLQASAATQHFKALFDHFTGPAEKIGAQIITSATKTGQAFLPTIGSFAFQNLGIIQRMLNQKGSSASTEGLFPWLKSPGGGLGIFQNLEGIFQQHLPTAIHAGTQAFEVFLHVVDDAARRMGGFLTTIDHFFTRLNTPAGLAGVDKTVGSLMALFRSWVGLLGAAGALIVDLFKPAVGLGKDFADQMHRLVNLTRDWIEQPGTQNVLHSLFSAHRQQLDAIFQVIRALWPALESTISAFAQVEAVVTRLTIGPLKALAHLVESITSHPLADKIIGWAGAIYIVNRGLGTLLTTLTVLIKRWGLAGAAAATSAAETDTALATEDASLATTTGATGALGTAISALGGKALLARLAALRLTFVGLLGPIGAALLAVYALDRAIKALTGNSPIAKAWGSAGWFADNTAGDKFKGNDPYPKGSGDYIEWMAGAEGLPPGWYKIGPNGKLVKSSATATGGTHVGAGDKSYKQGKKHQGRAQGAGGWKKKKKKTAPDGSPAVNWKQFVGHHPGEDCSLFTQRVYREIWHISIPRTSEEQFHGGMPASGTEVGDLLFYNGHNEFKPPGHVALYIGNGQLIQDNGSGTVQIMDVGALDSLGYMGSKTYLKKNAIGTSAPGFNPGASQGNLPTRVPKATKAASSGPALASKASIFSAMTAAQGGLSMIKSALTDSFAQLAGVRGPQDPMKMHPLATATAHFDPLLRMWRKQLQQLEDELHKHGLTAKMEAEILARIDRIKSKILAAFDAIKQAAQTQFQAATDAWSAFTSQFDSNFSGSQSTAATQIQAARSLLAKQAQALAIDSAQSSVLGGTAGVGMAQSYIDAMTQVLAGPGGEKLPYTQQEIDNWLSIWGQYYASLGYTPKQMYDAFNKLLASVGLPQIDNPFDTGGLPLPPGYGGDTPPPVGTIVPAGPRPGDSDYVYPGPQPKHPKHGHHPKHPHHPHHPHHHHHKHVVHVGHAHAARAAAQQSSSSDGSTSSSTPVNIEVKLEKGMEWLDKHITVVVDKEIVMQGKKANARARSGRY